MPSTTAPLLPLRAAAAAAATTSVRLAAVIGGRGSIGRSSSSCSTTTGRHEPSPPGRLSRLSAAVGGRQCSTFAGNAASSSSCTGSSKLQRRAASYRTVPTPQPLPSSARRSARASPSADARGSSPSSSAPLGDDLPDDLAFPRHKHPTAWEVLHLPVGASCRDVKAAYYKLVKTHHPDSKEANSSSHPLPAKERFHYLQTAYECLGKEGSRSQYLMNQTGWHYSTMQQYHPSYRNGFPPGGGRYPPRRTTSAGRTGWEQTAHDMYWSDLGRRQGRWSHDPRAEWTTKEREAWGPTAGLPWLRKWMPWLVEGGHDKGKVTRVIVFAMLASMAFNLVPSFVDFAPSGPDRTHALAVQALRQDLEDRAFIGDPREMKERRRERLQAMQREAEQAEEEERRRRRQVIDKATAAQAGVERRTERSQAAAARPDALPPQQQQQQQLALE